MPVSSTASAGARLIAKLKGDGITQTLLDYLPLAEDDNVGDDVRAALGAHAVRDGKPDPVLLEALDNKEAVKRSAAAEAFARSGDKDLRAKVRKFIETDKDVDLKFRVALALVTAARDKDVMPDLIKLTYEIPSDRAWRGETVFYAMAAEKLPAIPSGSDKAAREKARDAWLKWWDDNGKTVDLAKLDSPDRILGFTVVVEHDQRTGFGKVFEMTPDGKKRWEITNLQNPWDAQVRPGGQSVVIYENNSAILSERTIKGETKWSETIYSVKNIQILANGNILVFAQNQIIEWDKARKQVWTHAIPTSDLVSGWRVKNGNTVYATQNRQLIVLGRDGKELKKHTINFLNYNSSLSELTGNKVLLCEPQRLVEIDLDSGKELAKVAYALNPLFAQKLPTGKYLVTSQNRGNELAEVGADGKGTKVEAYKPADQWTKPWKAYKR